MAEKVIFLDVDGVLNYMSYRNTNTANIDLSKVEMLSHICIKTQANKEFLPNGMGSFFSVII